MSNLTDFFPGGGGGDYTTYAEVIAVGGGAGGPAGFYVCKTTSPPGASAPLNCTFTNSQMATGSGGGGQFRGCIKITAGETYPVVIGAGGAGAPAPSIAGSGVGSNGSPSKFGKYIEALGGGAGATLCICATNQPGRLGTIFTSCGGFSGGSGGVFSINPYDMGPGARCNVSWSSSVFFQFGVAARFAGYSHISSSPCGCNYGVTTPFARAYDCCAPVVQTGGFPLCGPGTPVARCCPSFYCLCVASTPYDAPAVPCGVRCKSVGCTRITATSCYPGSLQAAAANTGAGALDFKTAGDSGVVVIVYPCPFGAATSTPGAVNCTPVTGPQGYRSYKFTSSGSFTL